MTIYDTFKTRTAQALPRLAPAELKRIQRFGTLVCFKDGERLFEAGLTYFGMYVVLKGAIRISRYDGLGNSSVITEHTHGEFAGEISQLAGAPTLVNGHAVGDVEALMLTVEGLRALIIAEAELGERIVRAFILRRVEQIDSKDGGLVLVAAPGHPRLHALQGWLPATACRTGCWTPPATSRRARCANTISRKPRTGRWPCARMATSRKIPAWSTWGAASAPCRRSIRTISGT
jgi:thioredoxin reductase (NADPH)